MSTKRRTLLHAKALIRILTNARQSEVRKALDTLGLLEDAKEKAREEYYAVNDWLINKLDWAGAEHLNKAFKKILEFLNVLDPLANFNEKDLFDNYKDYIVDLNTLVDPVKQENEELKEKIKALEIVLDEKNKIIKNLKNEKTSLINQIKILEDKIKDLEELISGSGNEMEEFAVVSWYSCFKQYINNVANQSRTDVSIPECYFSLKNKYSNYI